MKAVFACVSLILISAGCVYAQDGAETTPLEPVPIPASYTVVPGDTLWDIAAKLYQDPYRWSALWQANRTAIPNPDRIYPDQVLMTNGTPAAAPVPAPAPVAAVTPPAPIAAPAAPEADVAAAVDEQEAAEAPAVPAEDDTAVAEYVSVDDADVAAPVETVVPVPASAPAVSRAAQPRPFGADGFVVPQHWNGDGYIVGDKDKKLMISDGDTVFLSLGAGLVTTGTRCTIYRRLKKVRNPDDGTLLGVEVRVLGTLEITHADSPDASTARVTNSREPISVGDIVRINE